MIGTYKVVEITYLGNGECFITDECEKNWIARLVKKKNTKGKGKKSVVQSIRQRYVSTKKT